jgi:GT2 family glycosyltransferase
MATKHDTYPDSADTGATIVVTPRERFSHAERTLASIYENTRAPFHLIYVSAGSPLPVQRFLEAAAEERGFELINVDRYLSPNQARNLALRSVRSPYVVFLENDSLVTPGWLDALVRCAEETQAWIVGPVYLVGDKIHMAGGQVAIREHQGRRFLHDQHHLFESDASSKNLPRERRTWDYVEFHCMLARMTAFEKVGLLDENLLCHHEHIDFCMRVRNAGGLVYVEPTAITSHVPPPPCEWWDLPYFMLRWSEAWNRSTRDHFCEKWGISFVRFFQDEADLERGDTYLRWTRAQRRLIAGLRVPSSGDAYRPDSLVEQAQLVIALFESVDRHYFDLSVIDPSGRALESGSHLDPQRLFDDLPRLLKNSEDRRVLRLRPIAEDDPVSPTLLRLDDRDPSDMALVKPHALLVLETGPETYQCWLAVVPKGWRDRAALKAWTGDTREDGDFALLPSSTTAAGTQVKFVAGCAGSILTVSQIESTGIAACLAGAYTC